MKTIGILGGMGPEASLEYYRQFIELAKEKTPKGNYPEIVIYNLNFEDFCRPVSEGKHDQVIRLLQEKLSDLAGAGADFAMMASNTPHLFFEQLEEEASIPILSIVHSAAKEAESRGLEKAVLLGTRFTMNAGFYQDEFENRGVELIVPAEEEGEFVHDKIMNELVVGEFEKGTKNRIIEIIQELREGEGIEGVVLGCTELPLLLDESELSISVLDTTRIHVKSGFERALER
ncbi:MAG: aspartate/glutamate racemase family protein [Candidatus Acetothermia bacterium]